MPIYEFRCSKCKKMFEVTRSRDQAGDPASCPEDGAAGARMWNSSAIAGFGANELDDDFGNDFGSDLSASDFGGGGDMDMGSGWGEGENSHGHDHGHSHPH